MTLPDKQYEAIVLGAGIVGAACFYELVNAGVRTLLLDAKRLSMGATGWSGAVVRVSHEDETSYEQAAYGRSFYRQFAADSHGKVPFVESGYLHFSSTDQLQKMVGRVGDDLKDIALLQAEQVRSLFPELDIKAEQAIYESKSGYMDPHLTTSALVKQGCYHGGDYMEAVQATHLYSSQGRTTGIETSLGRFDAPNIVLALGGTTPAFLDQVGIESDFLFSRLIQVSLFKGARKLSKAPCFIDDRYDLNGRFCPTTGGIFVGLPTRKIRSSYVGSEVAMQAHSHKTRDVGTQLYGWLAQAQLAGGIVHADAYSDQGHGVVGACPGADQGVFVASGFCGGGFKLAPAAAKKIRNLIA